MSKYKRLAGWLIGLWFVLSLGASGLQLFRNDAQRVGTAVAIAAVMPIVLFALWALWSAGFRVFLMSLKPRVLTALQTWRIIGFVFVLLEARGLLPAMFAYPAGYGDMLIGATASLVAWRLAEPRRQGAFIAWQVLGLADLVNAVATGTLSRVLEPHGISMLPMTVLPLSLVPTFLVPLFFIFHVICIAQARGWRVSAESGVRAAGPVAPTAA